MPSDPWAPLAHQFVDVHYGSLRGAVRTHVVHQHLRAHLAPPPSDVVDVGGGAGHQSLPLARDGYRVTIVDPSPAMLDRARGLLAGEPAEVAGRISLVEAAGEDAVEALEGRRFDAVLCHGVLMYVEEPTTLLDALAGLLAANGILSIVAKNVRSLAMRPALAGDWEGALRAFETDHQVNGLGVDTRADDVDELAAALGARGVGTIAWYGVRLFTDGWTVGRPADDPEDAVLAVELEASRRDPYRQLSRLFHLVGRRSPGPA